MSRIILPDPSLVLLIGPSGSGKSTFAARHFRSTEVISSDRLRAMISDDESDQSVSGTAFALLHRIAHARLSRRRLTVIDATNLDRDARRPLLRLARQFDLPAIAIVFNLALEICLARNLARPDRTVPTAIIEEQSAALQKSRAQIAGESFSAIYELDEKDLGEVTVERRTDEARG